MFIPNKIVSLLSIAFGFIGKIAKILLTVAGSIFALGSIVIFANEKGGGNIVGVILLILSAACFFGQRIFAVLQQGLFTLKNWYSSKM